MRLPSDALLQHLPSYLGFPYLGRGVSSLGPPVPAQPQLLGHCTGDRDQDHPHGKEMLKSKMAVWGGLTNSCEKKRSEKQRRKAKI